MTHTRSNGEYQIQVINGIAERIHKVTVHQFEIAADEDAEIMAAPHLWNWEHSEQGQWIKSHAVEQPVWHKQEDHMHYLVKFAITAKLRGKDYTFWTLKWPQTVHLV
jgi:hypothetical protein